MPQSVDFSTRYPATAVFWKIMGIFYNIIYWFIKIDGFYDENSRSENLSLG